MSNKNFSPKCEQNSVLGEFLPKIGKNGKKRRFFATKKKKGSHAYAVGKFSAIFTGKSDMTFCWVFTIFCSTTKYNSLILFRFWRNELSSKLI